MAHDSRSFLGDKGDRWRGKLRIRGPHLYHPETRTLMSFPRLLDGDQTRIASPKESDDANPILEGVTGPGAEKKKVLNRLHDGRRGHQLPGTLCWPARLTSLARSTHDRGVLRESCRTRITPFATPGIRKVRQLRDVRRATGNLVFQRDMVYEISCTAGDVGGDCMDERGEEGDRAADTPTRENWVARPRAEERVSASYIVTRTGTWSSRPVGHGPRRRS